MISIDLSREAVARREAEIDRRTAASTANGAARHQERRRVLAEIEGEEMAQAQAVNDRSEAMQERTRIATIVKLGRDAGRGRQALRTALLAPLTVDAARALITAMPHDAVASPDAAAVPSLISFGSTAAEGERRRIISVFAHPAAQGRFAATVALALEGSEALTAAQIAPVLSGLPLEPAPIDPAARLAQLAEGRAEFGPSDAPVQSKGEAVREGWKRAAAAANASIGAADPMPAAGNTGLDPAMTTARAGLGRS